MDRSDVEVIARRTVYSGYARIDELRLRHRRFGGGWGKEVVREVIERGRAVAVLPYDPQRDELVLIEQFRPGALDAGCPPWVVEVVAGIIGEGETAEEVARREAVEEAGVALGELVPICDALASPGILTERVAVFCGRADTAGAGGIYGLDHEGEDIRAFVVGFEAAMAMLAGGEIANMMAVVALQWLALNREMLRQRWR
jgi:ADP-ribose diphosphatase